MTPQQRLDLDSSELTLGTLPRFALAREQQRFVQKMIAIFATSALLMGGALFILPESIWRTLLASLAAASLLVVAALIDAWRVVRWRNRAVTLSSPSLSSSVATQGRVLHSLRGVIRRIANNIGADVGLPIAVGVLAAAALLAIRIGWTSTLTPIALGTPGVVAAAGALLIAFGLLVLERLLAMRSESEWPNAVRLAQYLRLQIGMLLTGAVCLFLAGSQPGILQATVLIGMLPAIVATELILRALLALFAPRNDRVEPAILTDSLLISLLTWPPRPIKALHGELYARFGIDLRQNWAFGFMRRAAVPIAGVLALVAWTLTGVQEISVDGRGIYERFGRPIEVWHAGLHWGLPRPFGRVRHAEFGTVHELAAGLSSEVASNDAETAGAEDAPPRSANRLWDASHAAEKSQVIASIGNGRQSFQIVNMDVRLIFRVGLDDASVLAATYRSADLPALMRSATNRVLVSYFAARTLDGILGARRAEMAQEIRSAVQAELDRFDAGVEILATVIESIHPPSGAANSYHAVQAAQIIGAAAIARERGRAAEELNTAQARASIAADTAAAVARETKTAAQAVQLRFAAERDAHSQAGRAFITEIYLQRLSEGLSKAELVVMDHRIGGSTAPTIDLRKFSVDVARSGGSSE